MRILMASENPLNPYVSIIVGELQKLPEVEVVFALEPLLNPALGFDIVHLQWVEEVFSFIQKSGNSRPAHHLVQLIEKWKQFSRVIFTVHNFKPHVRIPGMPIDFHLTVYQMADGLIHLGPASEPLLKSSENNFNSPVPHRIIPHPEINVPEHLPPIAHKLHKASSDKQSVLAFGRIRNAEEARMILRISEGLRNTGIELVVPLFRIPYLPFAPKGINRLLIGLKRFWLNLHPNRKVGSHYYLETEQMHSVIGQADLVLIPRIDALNSGIPFLAFAHGKTTAGPNVGNIGSLLVDSGNPVFNPRDIDSILNAIRKGLQLQKEGRGKKNRAYLNQYGNPSEVGKAHWKFYRELVD